MSAALNKKKQHNIVLTSTVMPQSCNDKIIPYIKKKIKKCKINFFYSPEFISIGNIIDEFINPRMILIGSNKDTNSDSLKRIYKKLCGKNIKIFQSSIENIEIAKMAVNCTMTTRISLMNTFSQVCDKTKNSDIDSVSKIIKNFFINFNKGFLAGLPYGGPCLPRDNIAMGRYLKINNIENNIPKATDIVNNSIILNIYKILKKKNIKKLLILGLSYKNDTPETTDSAAYKLIKKIKHNIEISIFDENLKDIDDKVFKNLKIIKNLKNEIKNHEAIIILKNKNYLKNYKLKKKTLLIDPWRIYKDRFALNKNYIPFGINNEI
jgi:UDPglucose 6-dehydrogenase